MCPKRPPAAACLAALMVVLALALPAGAHRPVFLEGQRPDSLAHALPVTDPRVSIAVYADLRAGEAQYFALAPTDLTRVHVELLVPDTQSGRGYRPRLVLLGPGLPQPTGQRPYAVPPGGGAEEVPLAKPTPFYEPFTQTRYVTLLKRELALPQPGKRYWLAVWSGRPGKYVLAVGTREDFGIADLPRFPGWWRRVRRFVGE